jgi:NAD-dependent dihydropyrimidine dehydrogenase PreA subunit
MPGTFIDITVADSVASDPELARKLADVCPVDIFAAGVGGDRILQIVESNLDECVLCELCINATPAGAVTVHKLYSGETLPPA